MASSASSHIYIPYMHVDDPHNARAHPDRTAQPQKIQIMCVCVCICEYVRATIARGRTRTCVCSLCADAQASAHVHTHACVSCLLVANTRTHTNALTINVFVCKCVYVCVCVAKSMCAFDTRLFDRIANNDGRPQWKRACVQGILSITAINCALCRCEFVSVRACVCVLRVRARCAHVGHRVRNQSNLHLVVANCA